MDVVGARQRPVYQELEYLWLVLSSYTEGVNKVDTQICKIKKLEDTLIMSGNSA